MQPSILHDGPNVLGKFAWRIKPLPLRFAGPCRLGSSVECQTRSIDASEVAQTIMLLLLVMSCQSQVVVSLSLIPAPYCRMELSPCHQMNVSCCCWMETFSAVACTG